MKRITAFGPLLAIVASIGSARGQGPPPVQDPNAPQVLTQGPIHEAFAEPVVFDPRPGPVIPKQPPQPVPEVPPDQRPEGGNVQWIPGYWAWDDSRNDFLWVSGIWRIPPPGRQWVPGYWNPAPGGFQWVPGAWMPIDPGQGNPAGLQYLPEPPQSLEAGPSSPAPGPNYSWASGCWVWQDNNYLWRPGYWVEVRPDWIWTPAHYVCTPSGYLFVDGYWDQGLDRRGTLFAPVYYSQPSYLQPGYSYSPSVALLAGGLLANLFVRPSYSSYYFGDYYGQNRFQAGYYPWYAFHQSRYGYDPLYAYSYARNIQRDPGWANQLQQSYLYRRDHIDARPPRTFLDQERALSRVHDVAVRNNINQGAFTHLGNFAPNNTLQGVAIGRPINQLAGLRPAAGAPGLRYERVEQARRVEYARNTQSLQQFRDLRVRQEAIRPGVPGGARPGAAIEAHRLNLPASPVVAPRRVEGLSAHEQARFAPPPHPAVGRAEAIAHPPAGNPAARRFEPHPEQHPPHFEPRYHAPQAPRVEPKRPEPGKGERNR